MIISTKKICAIGVLSALYVVLSAFLKINIIGNIQIDLGYMVFAVALCEFGIYGTFIGVIGCSVESILFSAYGFSISWMIANLTIGIAFGLLVKDKSSVLRKILITALGCVLGLLVLKTIIECALFSIPIAVKIPKNAVATCLDFIVMVFGIIVHQNLLSKIKYTYGYTSE